VKRLGAVPLIVIVLTAGLLGLLVYGVLNTGDDTSLDAAVKRGEQPAAPGRAVRLPRLGAPGSAALEDFKGKTVVLNFWASWCEPCREEAPILQRAHRRLEQAGAGTVLGVTYKDFAEESQRFERDNGLSFPSLRDDELELAPEFGTTKLPETFVIGPEGNVVAISRGQLDEEFLERALDRQLGEGGT
jgi:cytochrome c biogenesis protein CcmG/thiol:disulfide interchange protein DsbE